jgi:membrane protein required for colicin V production
MNYLDIIILVPMAWAVFSGYKRGFVLSLFSLLALFAGIYAGIYLSEGVSAFVVNSWNFNPDTAPAIAFSITFLAVVVGVWLLGRLLSGVVKATGLKPFDRVAGMMFSLARTLLVLSVILMFMEFVNQRKSFVKKELTEGSLLWKPVSEIVPTLIPYVRETEFYRSFMEQNDPAGFRPASTFGA